MFVLSGQDSKLDVLLKDFKVPTLSKSKAKIENSKEDTISKVQKKRREKDRKRAIYFRVGFSHYW